MVMEVGYNKRFATVLENPPARLAAISLVLLLFHLTSRLSSVASGMDSSATVRLVRLSMLS